MGMGYWTRSNVEICLIATKGKPRRKSKTVSQLIFSPREKHSKKPDITRDLIMELMGDFTKAGNVCEGEYTWMGCLGNEVNSTVDILNREDGR